MLNAPAPELLAAIVDSSDDGIVSMNLTGTIISWNPAAGRIFGYTAAEAVGHSITLLYPPDRLSEEKHLLGEIAAGRRVDHFETERVRSNGERIPVIVTLSPVRDASGTIVGASKIVREFGDKAILERRAREAAADLERVLSNLGEGYVTFDRSLRYVSVNDAAAAMIGQPREALIGRTPPEVFPPEAVAAAMSQLQRALESSETIRYEAYSPRQDRWYENRLHATDIGLSVFFTDITARKRAEEALRRSEERQRLLVSLNDATRSLSDPDAVMWAIVTKVGQHFEVGRCTYGEIDRAQHQVIVTRDYTDGVISIAGRHRLDDFGPALIRELRAGMTVAVRDVQDDPRTSDERAVAAFAAIETRSLLCIPLVKDGRFVALFVLHHPKPRDWSADEIALLEQIAERTWFGIENARAEAALRDSRNVLSLAMRGGRMGVWTRDLITEQVWWSRELEELFGLPPGGFEGTFQSFTALIYPDDRGRLEKAVQVAVESRTDYSAEFRFRHAGGAWRWMEGRGRAMYSTDGRPHTLYGLSIDITERKAFEVALARARESADKHAERLGIALAAARLGDWSWDARTDVVTLSTKAATIFGLAPGTPITWTGLRLLLHPDDRERARLAVEDAIAGHSDYAIEYRLGTQEVERWISASGRAGYDARGNLLGMFGVVQDITRDRLLVKLDDAVRRLADPEEITYTSASILGQHLGADRCAYATVDQDQNSFVVTGNYVNGLRSLVGRYKFRQFGEECLCLMRAGTPFVVRDSRVDHRIIDEDRAAYEAVGTRSVIWVPILKADRLVAVMAVQTVAPRTWRADEVELVQQVASRCWESIERARVEGERATLLEAAQAANRAKDEFLAMLGHELRNPLSPILTALQLMKLRNGGALERERTVIERQVTHLARLVDDLLDVSRIARGKVELKLEVVELGEIIARAVEVASPLLETRAQTLVMDVSRAGLPVTGDPARLAQIVSNLLTNAAKYTPPHGRVTIAAGHDGTDVVLRIQDTGVGIAPDVLPRVFDLFVQGGQSIDRAQGGLGLGLTIVKSLVERHGGTVSAHSDGLNRGSEFVVRLPLAAEAGRLAETPSAKRPARRRTPMAPRILVVDDNHDAAEMLSEVLRARGYDTRIAHDGPEALRVASAFLPETAFLDIGLPVMDGYELASRLREIPGLATVRLVAVTGYGQDSDRRRTRAAGFEHHMVKPVDLQALEDLVTTLRPPS
jgi:PAS domain S-box-containing protein